jgi:predicted nucleic acid-binding protein
VPTVAFDTNIFVYAAGIGEADADRQKVAISKALFAAIVAGEPPIVPIQVCLEFYHVLVRKRGLAPPFAAAMVSDYTEGAVIISTDPIVLDAVFDLAARHNFQTYDAVILACAARAGCEILYSEDMQHGFEWEGVRIVNPFA